MDAAGNYLLPDIAIDPDIAERAVRIYLLCEAFDWHLAPDIVERQDEQLMNAMQSLGGASALVKRLLEKEHEPAKKRK